MVELREVSAGYGKKQVLRQITAVIRPGELTAILGPNGCGKSTLLKTMLGLLPLSGGQILLDGEPLSAKAPGDIARRIAWLPQEKQTANMTAEQLVLCGRFPHLRYPRRYRQEDREIALAAMERLGIGHLAQMPLHTLSGGQRQSVYVAMALAQDTEWILLDEPATFLDIGGSFALMDTLKNLARQGKGVAAVLHDLPLAMEYADRVLLLQAGGLAAAGTPEEVWASGTVDRVFGIRMEKDRNGYFCRPAHREKQEHGMLF